jgi:CHAT domain-containing protein/tetratricopeptide (TPR) repeat protein
MIIRQMKELRKFNMLKENLTFNFTRFRLVKWLRCVVLSLFLLASHTVNMAHGQVEILRHSPAIFTPQHTNIAQQAGDRNKEEATLRQIIGELLRALEKNEFESYIKLWSENSPTYKRRMEVMPKQMASIKFAFSNPVFSQVAVEGEKASLRIGVDSRTFAPGDAGPLDQRVFYRFSFVKEGDSWKLWNQTDAQRDLAAALVGAKTEEERAALLKKEDEMVNVYLIQDLIDQGKAEFYKNNNLEQGAVSFRLANKIAELLQSRQSTPATKATVASTLHNLANIERARANYDKVLEYEERALSMSTSDDLKADAFINIGIIHALQNKYDLALKFFQQALESAKRVDEARGRNKLIGFIYDSMGNLLSLQGKTDEALAYYKDSLNYRTDPFERADTLANIGNVYESKGDLKGAQDQYQASLKIVEGKYALGTATVLNNLASVVLRRGDSKGSIAYAERAAELATRNHLPELQWRVNLIKGKAHRVLNEMAEARQSLDESIRVIEGMRGQVAGDIEEQQRFLEDKAEPFYVMIDFLMSERKSHEAFEYAERAKAKVLLDVLAGGMAILRRVMSDDELREEQGFLFKLANIDQNIRQAQLNAAANGSVIVTLRQQRVEMKQSYDDFINRLYTKYAEQIPQRGGASVINLEETAKLITDDQSALLEFSVGADSTYLYVITRKGVGQGIDLFPYKIEKGREALKQEVESFRSQIDNKDPDFRQPARDLYTLLLAPARAQLAGKKTLAIIPDGPLWDLPFQALQTGGDRFLIQDSSIFQAPSLTALREMTKQRQQSRGKEPSDMLALINPSISEGLAQRIQVVQMGKKLDPLPDPLVQVEALRRIYGGPPRTAIYTGPDASERRFQEEAGRYSLLYLFTHGVLDNKQPMRSYMVLTPTAGGSAESDGLLEAGELLRMNLKADLVILSGCETARGHFGAGEGVIGLSWALFVAGSPTVVVSQWRVPPQSTAQLMLEFHRLLRDSSNGASQHLSTAKALQRASLRVKLTKGYEHPLYWAGFIVVGDGQ